MNIIAKEIVRIKFGVASARKIEESAAYEVDTFKLTNDNPVGSLYDPRAGVVDAGVSCPTCGKMSRDCSGHPGFIRLPRPVINPLFKEYIDKFLELICHECYEPVVAQSAINLLIPPDTPSDKILDLIVEVAQKTKCCMECEASLGNYSMSKTGGEILMTTSSGKKSDSVRVSVERALEILEHITPEYIQLCGKDPARFQPKDIILQNLPVISVKARPPAYRAGQKCDDQLTAIYASLLRAIAQETADPSERKRVTKTTIESAIDDLFGVSKSTNTQQLMGLPPRLSGKRGTIRGNAVGKRANFTGRTVTGPDPYIRTNEVMIPPEMWKTLTKPVRVCRWNLDECQALVDSNEVSYVTTSDGKRKRLDIIMNRRGTRVYTGDEIIRASSAPAGTGSERAPAGSAGTKYKLKGDLAPPHSGPRYKVLSTDRDIKLHQGDRLFRNGVEHTDIVPHTRVGYRVRIGDVLDRYIRDGDSVVVNRQPSLHRGSMKALKMRRAKIGSTIRVQLAACASFNMDHDGDEANVHIPQGVQADVEISELMSEARNIVSDKSSTVVNTPIQEGILGMWMLSTENPSIPRAEFYRLCMRLVETDIFTRFDTILDVLETEELLFTGQGLISMIFPQDFYYTSNDFEIFCGVLLEGTLNKKNIKGVCHAIYNRYSSTEYLRVIDNMQYVANEYLVTRGITIHLGDLIPRHTAAVTDAITRVLFEVESLQDSLYDPVIAETRKINLLSNARDAGMSATKGALTRENNIIKITESGAKGAKFNVAQIHAGLGQQILSDGIVKPTLNGNRRILPHEPWNPSMHMRYECNGFVASSFARGLSPRESLFHAQVGRKDIASTCIGTQETGYMQRRMVKRGEDAKIASNGMVLGHGSAVIQPVYGEDGIDSQELIRVRGVLTFCDVEAIVETLNNEFEFTNRDE